MTTPLALPLYDPQAEPSSWNERMREGDYAVHYSAFYSQGTAAPYCSIFPSMQEAETYAKEQTALHPELRCTIYDSNGFVGAPLRDIRGIDYKDKGEISARFRRWCGSILFFGGLILTLADWSVDFRYLWPSALGTRMLMPGLVLLFTEAMVMWYASRHKKTNHSQV
jgi:hypothetical protein